MDTNAFLRASLDADKLLPAAGLSAHFDGLCEPRNPGGVATLAWTLGTYPAPANVGNPAYSVLHQFHAVLADGGPRATNNWAEWCAFGTLLRHLVDVGYASKVKIFGDSKLVVSQFNGDWRINAPHITRLAARCFELSERLASQGCSLAVCWVPRDLNTAADSLAEHAFFEYARDVRPSLERQFHLAKDWRAKKKGRRKS